MAGFSSMDDFINKVTNLNQKIRIDWNKNFLPTTPAVAGEWFCLARGGGNPGADSVYNSGASASFTAMSDTSISAGGIRHGGNVSPYYKHVVNASAFTAAATVAPCVLMLVDLLGAYRITATVSNAMQTMTNTLSAFSNFTVDETTDVITHSNINLFPYTRVQLSTTTTLPGGLSAATDYYVIKQTDTTIKLASSYANAVSASPIAIDILDTGTGVHTINTLLPRYTSGAGVQAFAWANNATPLGAGTPNLILTATDSSQTSGKVTPLVYPVGKTAAANGLIIYTGTGVGKYGPFIPQSAGSSGIAKIDNYQISATYTSGEFSIGLCVPILTLPITTLGVASERDLINQIPSLPRIYDGANLIWLIYNGAATPINSAIAGHLDFAWG